MTFILNRLYKTLGTVLLLCFFLLPCIVFIPHEVAAKEKDTILVAAASNLQFVMDDIIKFYERKKPDIKVKIVYGSSGNFFNQIINGAPFDLFFSADFRYPEELLQRGLGKEVATYAFGRIVVMVPVNSKIEVQKLGLKALFHPAVKKIAIANPAYAPYGMAAVTFLKKQNIYETLKGKLVLGENISRATQFVESGAAEIGIIALALALKAKKSVYWKIPLETCPPIEQKLIILKRTKRYSIVREFADFLQSMEGKNILVHYGFNIPGKKSH